ncbi:MAG TPA: hypothetical protein VK706_05380 [Candidatus Sulfotelmatobacter sp.]|jgi:hypothetical protein|nr:hypothetical protein [Candidatus Sulfotelmatobacter sp.]
MALHGKITAALAGSTTALTSLASAAVNLPIVWKTTKNKSCHEGIDHRDGHRY